jgi:phosphohistidine phosphatase
MTERSLVLVRHAAAASGHVDLDRPLTDAGRQAAADVGAWLADVDLIPNRTVISPSRRTQQTWDEIGAALNVAAEPTPDDRLYENTPEALLDVVRETPADVVTLMLIGHNPSIYALATILDDGDGDAGLRARLAQGVPASGAVAFTVREPFTATVAGCATLIHIRTAG